jgi:hypothetical protein
MTELPSPGTTSSNTPKNAFTKILFILFPLLILTNLITSYILYRYQTSTRQLPSPSTVTPTSTPEVITSPSEIDQLQKKISDLEIQNRYLEYIAYEDNHLQLTPPQVDNDQLKVKLYYYNRQKDKEIASYIPCVAVLPVERQIPVTNTPIKDTIELLIKGELTPEEKAEGFSSEFPHPEFQLLGVNLNDRTLTLEFSEVPSFTTGGSCRVSILAKEVTLTAQQFPEVDQVVFAPYSIFQP